MDGYANPVINPLLTIILSLCLAQGPIITGHRGVRSHGAETRNPGTVTLGYTNSASIAKCDGTFATATVNASSIGGHFVASNFGFSIPSGATIAGITAYITHWDESGNGGMQDYLVQLEK